MTSDGKRTYRFGQLERILRTRVKPWLRKVRKQLAALFLQQDLLALAKLFETDKWNAHWYIPHYARYLRPLRLKRLNILEIGIGGYEDPKAGGHSLRMWKAFFPFSRIYGIDLHDKKALEEGRIKTFQGSQDDVAFLKRVAAEIGTLDIVIDDGSHVNSEVIKTFETLFPYLSRSGIYVVEDTQTSYWPGLGGSSADLNRPDTIMGYFKGLADGLNHEERIQPGYVPSHFDRHIVAIHFTHNLVFILKGENTEGSNILRNNTTDESWILRCQVSSLGQAEGKLSRKRGSTPACRQAGQRQATP